MELLNDLELVDVVFEDSKAVLTFLDAERGEIREVTFNKKVYDQDNKKFIPDAEKAEKVEQWCQEFFNVEFDRLAECIGERKDIYAYPKFNSLFEVQMTNKFSTDDEGQIFQTTVSKIEDDGKAIHIYFEFDGKTYSSKMSYADYMESRKEWFVNPVKRAKQFEKFEDKFGINADNLQEMTGKEIMCEVKVAFNKFPYVEIKPFKKKK